MLQSNSDHSHTCIQNPVKGLRGFNLTHSMMPRCDCPFPCFTGEEFGGTKKWDKRVSARFSVPCSFVCQNLQFPAVSAGTGENQKNMSKNLRIETASSFLFDPKKVIPPLFDPKKCYSSFVSPC